MFENFIAALIGLLSPEPARGEGGKHEHLLIRWFFLRALGLIYFSAFLPLIYEIRGMLGASGILPIADYLQAVAGAMSGLPRYWYAPTVLWIGASDRALMVLCWVGIAASVCAVLNLWPRMSLLVCFVCFLSFVCVAQEFASFQSDGMLLEAGFIALFFAPAGLRPGLGAASPPIRASLYLLRWEWFRIYFESGVVKIASGDQSWRHLTAMDDYYQNGPLPTWIGWYVQHLPHWFHASAAFMTLFSELALVWMLFLPRRARIICFCIVTPFQISIILTANYTFLNYIVLLLGILLLDDKVARVVLPGKFLAWIGYGEVAPFGGTGTDAVAVSATPASSEVPAWRAAIAPFRYLVLVICLGMVFYATTAELLWMFVPIAAAADFAGDGAGAFANRKSIWALRGDDAPAVRGGVSRLERMAGKRGRRIRSGLSRRRSIRRRGFTRPTSRDLSGACGSRRWILGATTGGCSRRPNACCRTTRRC